MRDADADDDLHDLLSEIKSATAGVMARDVVVKARVDELEQSINELLLSSRRPGGESYGDDRDGERSSAIQMCVDRNSWRNQKQEGRWVDYAPSGVEIEEAMTARVAVHH